MAERYSYRKDPHSMPDPTNNDLRRQSILVVTQNAADLEALREKLGANEYDLRQAEDPDRALARAQSEKPDLVLLDMTGPDPDGLEFCQALRHSPETDAVPVVLIVDSETEVSEHMLEMGADGFVSRPFRQAVLRSRVRTLLRMKEWHEKVAEQNRKLLEVNARLDAINQELMARNRELEQSMEMAHRLQSAMLPQKYPRVENVHFSHYYSPAEAVGGDIFHIDGLPGGRAAIFLADVSGHGIRAALITSIVKAVIDYIDVTEKTPTDVLSDFNTRFRSVLGPLAPQIYATGVVILVEGESRTISMANAGHPCPLLISREDGTAEPIMRLEDTGPALGFLSDPDYPTFQRELTTGDTVLTFTDGIYEILNAEDEMFGLDRLRALVADNTHLIPRDLIQKLVTETEEFMAAPRRPDDVCIVTVEMA